MEDTIAAIATAPGEGGIGIVRISGEASRAILEKIFSRVKKEYHKQQSVSREDEKKYFFLPDAMSETIGLPIEPRKMHYGFIYDNFSGELIDEVMAVWFKAPYSYTAEDVVEIQGESLQNAEHVFDKIQEQFTELISNLDEITNGIDTIADAKAQTIDAIQSISAVSQETAAASEEVTETANRQLQQVEALNEAAQNLNQNSSALANAIDLFKI